MLNPLIPSRISTMSNRFRRLLMFWLVIALQAITPFIHAHAGAAQLKHSGFMHVHTPIRSDIAYQAVSTDDHDADFGVAQGLPLRHAALGAVEDASLCVVSMIQPAADRVDALGVPFPAFPTGCSPPPDHALPLALAPPRR